MYSPRKPICAKRLPFLWNRFLFFKFKFHCSTFTPFPLTFRFVPYFLWHVWSFAIFCLFKKVCVSGILKEKRKLRYVFLVLDSYPCQKWSNQLGVPFFKHHSSTLLESSDKIKLVREEIWAGFKSKTGSSNTAFKRGKKKKKRSISHKLKWI